MDQKYGETDIKFEETNEHSEIIRVFVQSGNGSKIWENWPKILGNRSKIWGNRSILKF